MIKPGQLPALLHFSCPGIYDMKNPAQLSNHNLPGVYFIPSWAPFHSCLVVPFHSLPGPFSLLPDTFSFFAWTFFIPSQALFHSCLVLFHSLSGFFFILCLVIFHSLSGSFSFSSRHLFIPAWTFFISCLVLFHSLPGTFSFLPGSLPGACDQFPKKEILSDDGASFLDLESIWIILIASFLNEINAKYLWNPSDENLSKSKFGLYYWWWLFLHEFTWCYVPLTSIYIFVRIWGHNMT